MLADNFNFQVAAGLHRDRLDEADSIRRAAAARAAEKASRDGNLKTKRDSRAWNPTRALRQVIGRQLIALGERMTA